MSLFAHRYDTPATGVDLFIIGAGPAGLACAIAAALRGLTVAIADGMKPPIDKACGEGLMPDTVAALAELGLHVPAADSASLRGIRFIDQREAKLVTATVQADFPAGPGRGVKRLLLHQLLLDRALELGVSFHWQTVVQGIEGDAIYTNRGTMSASYIVGADGHQSRVRAWAGLGRSARSLFRPARRIGLRQHFAIAPWTSHVEVHWSRNGQAYVTPVSSTEVCVAFVARAKFSSVAEAIAQFPQLGARLAGAPPSDTPRGSITLSRTLRRVTCGNIALVGDASGSVDAITGEGLSLCFRQALALASALHSGDLSQYQRAHDEIRQLPHLMACLLLSLDSSPHLRKVAFAVLERRPKLFQRMLEVHVGHNSPILFSGKGVFAAGVRFITG